MVAYDLLTSPTKYLFAESKAYGTALSLTQVVTEDVNFETKAFPNLVTGEKNSFNVSKGPVTI